MGRAIDGVQCKVHTTYIHTNTSVGMDYTNNIAVANIGRAGLPRIFLCTSVQTIVSLACESSRDRTDAGQVLSLQHAVSVLVADAPPH